MIIYNIRANGPYEYDKLMLLYGQLHNLAVQAKESWDTHAVHQQDDLLSEIIASAVGENDEGNNLLNTILTLKELMTE